MLPPSSEPTAPFLALVEPKSEAEPIVEDDKADDHNEGEVIDAEAGLIDIPKFDTHLVEDDPIPVQNISYCRQSMRSTS